MGLSLVQMSDDTMASVLCLFCRGDRVGVTPILDGARRIREDTLLLQRPYLDPPLCSSSLLIPGDLGQDYSCRVVTPSQYVCAV